MRKKSEKLNIRKSLSMLAGIVMLTSLCACGDSQAKEEEVISTSTTVSSSAEPAVAEQIPVLDSEELAVDSVEDTLVVDENVQNEEPTEESVEEDTGFIKQDFIDWLNTGEGNWWSYNDKSEYLLLAVRDSDIESVQNVLNGDTIILPAECRLYLLTPKNVVDSSNLEIMEGDVHISGSGNIDDHGVGYEKILYSLRLADDSATFDNMPVTINVTYEDGTTETISFYLTRQ